ncbi:hypothetical protein MNBD_ACTINO01-994 [hydrothermal vent metagenome]|uniref:Uncharacterized protein n=1 Tax=hydrothermal vent metagenome TaxID=652676 RepID=A0A3B0S6D8_9ZZZZ
MTTATINDFDTQTTTGPPERIMPQKVGSALWAPMFVMSLMGFTVGFVLAIIKANLIATGGNPLDIAAISQYQPAAMFLGFASVFAAISFAIAKILGEFRVGGGSVQQAANADVKTLQMPTTAKVFIGIMVMAMMVILAAVVLHIVAGATIAGGGVSALQVEQWTIWLEAARRFGVQLYLFSILLGLASIIQVIRYQSFRIRQVAETL